MRAAKLADGKFDVGADLVGRLIASQFPTWAELPVRPVERDGWDNWSFRLGDTLRVRLPSAEGYVPQVEKEALWVPRLAPLLPLPVPVPLAVGRPGAGYPWPWTVGPWLEDEPVTREAVADPVALGRDLAGFLVALQALPVGEGPPAGAHSFHRGGSLAVYDSEARGCITMLGDRIDAAAALAVWDAALAAVWSGPPCWVHGDLAVGNLLLRDGRLGAVLDFGCCAVGDPACDLVIAWTFLDGAARDAFREAVPADAAMWARARGWALWKAALIVAYGLVRQPAERPAEAVIADVIAEQLG